MSGIESTDEESVAKEMTDQIFRHIDKNADGKISLDEFIDGAQKDKHLVELLGNTWALKCQNKNLKVWIAIE